MKNYPVVRVAFLDVGQGDTIVVSLPETKEAVIIDCIDANAVMQYLEHEGIQHLRGLLITHLHLDHYSGVVQFLNNLQQELNLDCERILFHRPLLSANLRDTLLNDEDGHADGHLDEKSKKRKRQTSIADLLRWGQVHKEQYNNLTLQPGITLPLDPIIELIHPWEVGVTELLSHGLNNTSGIVKVKGSKSSILLTGDIEPFGWAQVDNKGNLQSDVLKFPHHGAWKDNSVDHLLDIVQPSFIVISVGSDGTRYGHPNQHVFDAISQRANVRLLCTQATKQCCQGIEIPQRSVTDLFKQESEQDVDFFFVAQRGCPCAGTVIIELHDTVKVIQPKTNFHHHKIIEQHYNTHQCMLHK